MAIPRPFGSVPPAMTVHCEGDFRIVEQLGEKQDFEAELSRRGFRHEDFTLHVAFERTARSRRTSVQDYLVTVANVANQQQRAYRGGPRFEWVTQCACDLAAGAFGRPVLRQA